MGRTKKRKGSKGGHRGLAFTTLIHYDTGVLLGKRVMDVLRGIIPCKEGEERLAETGLVIDPEQNDPPVGHAVLCISQHGCPMSIYPPVVPKKGAAQRSIPIPATVLSG